MRDMPGLLRACKDRFLRPICAVLLVCFIRKYVDNMTGGLPDVSKVDNGDQTLLTQRLKQANTFLVKGIS